MLPFIIGAAVVAGVVYALSRSDKHSPESLEFHVRYENEALSVIHGNPRPRVLAALKDVLRGQNNAASIYLLKAGNVDIDGNIPEKTKQRIRNTISAEV